MTQQNAFGGGEGNAGDKEQGGVGWW